MSDRLAVYSPVLATETLALPTWKVCTALPIALQLPIAEPVTCQLSSRRQHLLGAGRAQFQLVDLASYHKRTEEKEEKKGHNNQLSEK